MRRVALVLGLAVALFWVGTIVVVALATAALGSASAGARVAAVAGGIAVVVLALALIGRSVRRAVGPIGAVMEAADRVADGDYSVRVQARGPGEVRRLGRSFNEMTARLEASDDQRRRLLADVAHELRTPLAIIRGNVEGIADGLYLADAERLGVVIEETRVMARLLDDLQVLSTAEAGTLRLEREPADLRAIAAEVAAGFGPRAAAGGVALAVEGDGAPEAEVDVVRVRQVLENLVANALRHTPPGGRVTIAVAAAGEGVELAVSDSGSGIPAAELAGIFDRYTRAADSGGSGLGLAIARSLVQAHRGTIEAESAPGHGATIRVRLPASAADTS